MARQLKWWIAAALLVCAAVGVAYLPPRAAPVFTRRFRVLGPPPPYQVRVEELAAAWRSAALQLRLRRYRDQLRPELERRRALDLPGPALLIDWPDAPDSLRRRAAAHLDAEWRELGIGVSKISVGVVVLLESPRPDPGQPRAPLVTAYLLPDTTDRSTCLVLQTFSRAERWPLPNLGLCAFYAAFGTPGTGVRRWLGGRGFDLALWPEWGRVRPAGGPEWLLDPKKPWFWSQVYRNQPDGIACLAGRPDRCRSAVLGVAPLDHDPPPLVVDEGFWWLNPPALAGASEYLADVVRTVGRERFQYFWNSELPADTALAAALRQPVGEWTQQWQAGLLPPIQLGPTMAPGPVLLGLLLAAIALGLAVRTSARREVR